MKSLIAYLWPFAAYRDADQGSMMERAAAWRHNQRLSKSLPTYINRWAMSASIELVLTKVMPAMLVPVFGMIFTVSVCALMLCVAIWMLFKRA
jgi:preprotein translocase subunit SecY